ncbi:alanine racemase [Candidatus Dependentiae bacterium]|nr:alanine racemase [Candidatus Dependentiae bacterium]MCC7414807.1 alanine racemase [Campylobacterota bacterium]
MSRATLAILSTENLLHNLSIIKKQAPGANIIAMVKANAYGHGLRSVSLRLDKQVDSLGVASINEALALRKAGVKGPITLMEGVFSPDELLIASCEKFHVVFHEWTQIKWLQSATLPIPLAAWLKIDTGMGRLGFLPEDVVDAYEQVQAHRSIAKPLGIMSHLACADETAHPLNKQQITLFAMLANSFSGPTSLCNSAALFTLPEYHYTTVRPGISLYGISPLPNLSAAQLGLKPVMTLQTRLMAVRVARKGSSIGYGAQFVCPEDMLVGVIAMGYGDGYPRSARNGTPLLVNGIRCHTIGRISMDMMTIDLRNCPDAQVADPVILWGDGLPLEEVVRFTSSIPYDMLTAIQTRVTFQWTQF